MYWKDAGQLARALKCLQAVYLICLKKLCSIVCQFASSCAMARCVTVMPMMKFEGTPELFICFELRLGSAFVYRLPSYSIAKYLMGWLRASSMLLAFHLPVAIFDRLIFWCCCSCQLAWAWCALNWPCYLDSSQRIETNQVVSFCDLVFVLMHSTCDMPVFSMLWLFRLVAAN